MIILDMNLFSLNNYTPARIVLYVYGALIIAVLVRLYSITSAMDAYATGSLFPATVLITVIDIPLLLVSFFSLWVILSCLVSLLNQSSGNLLKIEKVYSSIARTLIIIFSIGIFVTCFSIFVKFSLFSLINGY